MRTCSRTGCKEKAEIGSLCTTHWQQSVMMGAQVDYQADGEIEQLVIAPPSLALSQESCMEVQFLPTQTAKQRRELEANGWRLIWVFGDTERWWRTKSEMAAVRATAVQRHGEGMDSAPCPLAINNTRGS